MVRPLEMGSQDHWLSGGRNPARQHSRRINAVPLTHRLRRPALFMSVMGVVLLSAAYVAMSQDASPSLPLPDARMKAPIGHRQPRPSDLPPSVQRDEQLNPPSTETQPTETQPAQTQHQGQTPNRGTRAANVPTVDIQKGCEEAEKDVGEILGPNNGITAGSCLKEEQDARQTMINNWTKYPQGDKQKSIDTTGYLPSYVEWLTCLEMYSEVKEIENPPKDQAQTSGGGRHGGHHR